MITRDEFAELTKWRDKEYIAVADYIRIKYLLCKCGNTSIQVADIIPIIEYIKITDCGKTLDLFEPLKLYRLSDDEKELYDTIARHNQPLTYFTACCLCVLIHITEETLVTENEVAWFAANGIRPNSYMRNPFFG